MNGARYVDCTEYIVKPSQTDGWMTQIDDEQTGPYLSRDFALRVAVAGALALRKSGRAVRVVVEDDTGEVCAARCLCTRFGR